MVSGVDGRSFWVMIWRIWVDAEAGSLGVPGLGDWPKDLAKFPTMASVFSEGVEGLGGLERMFSCRKGGVIRGRVSSVAGDFETIAGGEIRVCMAEICERHMFNV